MKPDDLIDFGPHALSATYAEVMSWPGLKGPFLESRKRIRALREATRATRVAEHAAQPECDPGLDPYPPPDSD